MTSLSGLWWTRISWIACAYWSMMQETRVLSLPVERCLFLARSWVQRFVDWVTKDMSIYGQESFGPVVAVIRARDADHAIELANDSDFGLAASVFATDINEAIRVANSIDSGICHINGPTVFDEAQMPFGGIKDSGYGKFGGQQGVEQFTELRWLTIEDPNQHYPFLRAGCKCARSRMDDWHLLEEGCLARED